jgi:hypothetical protein
MINNQAPRTKQFSIIESSMSKTPLRGMLLVIEYSKIGHCLVLGA